MFLLCVSLFYKVPLKDLGWAIITKYKGFFSLPAVGTYLKFIVVKEKGNINIYQEEAREIEEM